MIHNERDVKTLHISQNLGLSCRGFAGGEQRSTFVIKSSIL